jgi:hypothetical protein
LWNSFPDLGRLQKDGFGDSFKNIEWTILNGSNMNNMLKDLSDIVLSARERIEYHP